MPERDTRFNSKGQIFISQVTNTSALLKNLSSSGLCMESPDYVEIIPKTRYSVDIIPEEDSNLDPFSLEIESKWVKAKMKSSESGFVIVVPPGTSGEALLDQYLQFLSSQTDNEIQNDSAPSADTDTSAETDTPAETDTSAETEDS